MPIMHLPPEFKLPDNPLRGLPPDNPLSHKKLLETQKIIQQQKKNNHAPEE
jgi:hypothetical protein